MAVLSQNPSSTATQQVSAQTIGAPQNPQEILDHLHAILSRPYKPQMVGGR